MNAATLRIEDAVITIKKHAGDCWEIDDKQRLLSSNIFFKIVFSPGRNWNISVFFLQIRGQIFFSFSSNERDSEE
jgi:hypothetical protein